jgi:arylamine N-acetyltransferase
MLKFFSSPKFLQSRLSARCLVPRLHISIIISTDNKSFDAGFKASKNHRPLKLQGERQKLTMHDAAFNFS